MLDIEIEGLSQLKKNLHNFDRYFQEELLNEIELIAYNIFEESQERVPVDTGELLRSGSVNIEGDTISISYDADHALPVHERVEVRHNNGEAKFLERALDNHMGDVQDAVERAFRSAFSRAV